MSYPIIDVQPSQGGAPRRYPFADLKVGQAFTVEHPTIAKESMRTYAALRGRLDGRKFKLTVLENGDFQVARVA